MHQIQQVSLCPLFYFSTKGVTMLTGFPRTRWPRRGFSESYAVRISVKIARICKFRVIMGKMTGLLGCCSSSTLGSRANDYVKTLVTLGFTLGFWLHHSPCSLGCWTNNTLAARSLSPNYHHPWACLAEKKGVSWRKFNSWNYAKYHMNSSCRYWQKIWELRKRKVLVLNNFRFIL